MICRTQSLVPLLFVIALATPGVADAYDDSDAGWGAENTPQLFTLERQDRNTRFGLQTGWALGEHLDNSATMRFDMYGQAAFNVGSGAVGAYVDIPFAMALGENSRASISNMEFGGYYVAGISFLDVVMRFGVNVPSASQSVEGAALNVFTGIERVTDIVQSYPDTTSLRFSASPMIKLGPLFARADFGFDVPIDWPGADVIMRMNAGGGLDLGSVAVFAEWSNLGELGGALKSPLGGPISSKDRWIHTLALGIRFPIGIIQPGVALIFPLDDAINEVVPAYLSTSLEIAI